MGGGFSVRVSALEAGSQAMSGHADGFGSIGDTVATAVSNGTEFGSMPVSGQLSDLTSRFSALHGQQFGHAQMVLRGTANSLYGAGQDYGNADSGASSAAKGIVTG